MLAVMLPPCPPQEALLLHDLRVRPVSYSRLPKVTLSLRSVVEDLQPSSRKDPSSSHLEDSDPYGLKKPLPSDDGRLHDDWDFLEGRVSGWFHATGRNGKVFSRTGGDMRLKLTITVSMPLEKVSRELGTRLQAENHRR